MFYQTVDNYLSHLIVNQIKGVFMSNSGTPWIYDEPFVMGNDSQTYICRMIKPKNRTYWAAQNKYEFQANIQLILTASEMIECLELLVATREINGRALEYTSWVIKQARGKL